MFKSKLAKNTFSSVILKLATIICGFILPRLILKTYGSEVNGLISSITQFLGMIAFLELGVGSVVQSSLYKPLANKSREDISKIVASAQRFFNRLGIILLIYVIVLVLVYPNIVNSNFDFTFTAILIVIISINIFAQYFFGIVNTLLLNADQNGYISYNIQIITIIINTFVCCLLIKLGVSIQIVKLVSSIILLAKPVFLAYYVKRQYCIDVNVKYEHEPIGQKWNGVAQHVMSVIIDNSPIVILTFLMPINIVSVYSVYMLVINGIQGLVLSYYESLKPNLGHVISSENVNSLQQRFSESNWLLNTLITCLFSVTCVTITPFILVYTNGINDTNYNIPGFALLLTMAYAFYGYRLSYNVIIIAAGHFKETQSSYVYAALINVIATVLFVRMFGINGVGLGLLLTMVYQTFWMANYVSKHLVNWPKHNTYKQICVNVISFTLVFVFGNNLTPHNLNYLSWSVLLIKIIILTITISVTINFVCYKEKTKLLFCKKII